MTRILCKSGLTNFTNFVTLGTDSAERREAIEGNNWLQRQVPSKVTNPRKSLDNKKKEPTHKDSGQSAAWHILVAVGQRNIAVIDCPLSTCCGH